MLDADTELTERFIRHLALERRLSELTCKNYRRDLRRLTDYCDEIGVERWRDLDSGHVRAFASACYRPR